MLQVGEGTFEVSGFDISYVRRGTSRENEVLWRPRGRLERALRSASVKSSPSSRSITKHLKNSSKSAGFKLERSLIGESGLILGRFSWRELLGVVVAWFMSESVKASLDLDEDSVHVIWGRATLAILRLSKFEGLVKILVSLRGREREREFYLWTKRRELGVGWKEEEKKVAPV